MRQKGLGNTMASSMKTSVKTTETTKKQTKCQEIAKGWDCKYINVNSIPILEKDTFHTPSQNINRKDLKTSNKDY